MKKNVSAFLFCVFVCGWIGGYVHLRSHGTMKATLRKLFLLGSHWFVYNLCGLYIYIFLLYLIWNTWVVLKETWPYLVCLSALAWCWRQQNGLVALCHPMSVVCFATMLSLHHVPNIFNGVETYHCLYFCTCLTKCYFTLITTSVHLLSCGRKLWVVL